jgi:hypothetical protein
MRIRQVFWKKGTNKGTSQLLVFAAGLSIARIAAGE